MTHIVQGPPHGGPMKLQTVLSKARKELDPIPYQMFEFLIERLRKEGLPTNYEPVGRHVGLPWQHDNLGPHLAAATEYTHEQYDFLISSMVHVLGTGEPGNGFAMFAWTDLGVRIDSKLWYDQELQKMVGWARSLQ